MAKRRSSQQQWDDMAQVPEEADDYYLTDMLREARALQQEGRIDESIELCEELVATYGSSEARYFLAWMYQEEHIWDGAIEHYTALLDDLDYALSCYYALGQCYRAKGDLQTAVNYFDEAVDRVNLDALEQDEADQLIQLCHEAARTHDDLGNREASDTVYNALLGFLRSRGWQDHVTNVEKLMAQRRPPGASIPPTSGVHPNTRASAVVPTPQPQNPKPKQVSQVMPVVPPSPPSASIPPGVSIHPTPVGPLDDAFLMDRPAGAMPMPQVPPRVGSIPGAGMSVPMPAVKAGGALGELSNLTRFGKVPPQLPEPQRTQVINAMRNVESYISHGLYTAAIEECLRIIEIAPQYLDIHQALAEIYVQQGKIDQAITKYAILIDNFLVNGRIDDAIAAYRRILQLEPNNLTYRVRLINLLAQHGRSDDMLQERISAAEAYLRLGYPDRAIEQFEQALVSSPMNLMLRQNYALSLIRAGRVNQGIGELQRILQVNPNNILALTRWQIALCSGAPSLSGSSVMANSAVRMMPGDGSTRVAAVEILGRLIRALRSENMMGYDDSLAEYTSAIENSPSNGDLRYAMSVMYHAGNRLGEAVSTYQQSAGTAGLEVLSHVGAGSALMSLNDPGAVQMAVREFEEAGALVRRIPISPALWSAHPRFLNEEAVAPDIEIAQLLSRAYQMSNGATGGTGGASSLPSMAGTPASISAMSTGRSSSAFADEIYRTINEIAARHPNDTPGALQEMVQLVRHHRSQRQFEQAVVVLNEISRIAPEDASVHAELADIHISRGQLEEGIEELRKVVELHGRHNQINEASQVLQQIAEVQWQMDKQDEAMGMLKQALNLTPDDMGARMLYVQYCLERGLRKEAAEQQTVLARYYYHSRQTKEAVAMLQQLIALDRDNFEAYDLLGQTYFSVGEYDQAQRVYRHLAKLNPSSSIARERLAQIQEMRARR
jgi:tetratricopeptide (TPR) repeat protein